MNSGSGFRVPGSGSGFEVRVPGSGFRFEVRVPGPSPELVAGSWKPGLKLEARPERQLRADGLKLRAEPDSSQ
jgi:hypothetical protein